DQFLRKRAAQVLKEAEEADAAAQRSDPRGATAAAAAASSSSSDAATAAAAGPPPSARQPPSSSPSTSSPAPADQPQLLHVSELNRRFQEMEGHYVLLEEYYMVESVRKAMRLDDASPDSLTSSAVDHVFFVLRKAVERALLTRSADALCAVLNNAIA